VLAALVNWDSLIARYNFRHADRSFLHLDYLAGLSDKTLPYLDVPLPELKELHALQEAKFPFVHKYMSPVRYHRIVEQRKLRFMETWEDKGIWSWNYPEWRAYHIIRSATLSEQQKGG
jgi:hypothetical protein